MSDSIYLIQLYGNDFQRQIVVHKSLMPADVAQNFNSLELCNCASDYLATATCNALAIHVCNTYLISFFFSSTSESSCPCLAQPILKLLSGTYLPCHSISSTLHDGPSILLLCNVVVLLLCDRYYSKNHLTMHPF